MAIEEETAHVIFWVTVLVIYLLYMLNKHKQINLRKMFGIKDNLNIQVYKKPRRCSSVTFEEGGRIDDGVGTTDYSTWYKVRRGKVNKKILRKAPGGEGSSQFAKVRLTPKTNSAYVIIRTQYSYPGKETPNKCWKIRLTKDKKYRNVKIRI